MTKLCNAIADLVTLLCVPWITLYYLLVMAKTYLKKHPPMQAPYQPR